MNVLMKIITSNFSEVIDKNHLYTFFGTPCVLWTRNMVLSLIGPFLWWLHPAAMEQNFLIPVQWRHKNCCKAVSTRLFCLKMVSAQSVEVSGSSSEFQETFFLNFENFRKNSAPWFHAEYTFLEIVFGTLSRCFVQQNPDFLCPDLPGSPSLESWELARNLTLGHDFAEKLGFLLKNRNFLGSFGGHRAAPAITKVSCRRRP